MRKHVTTFLMWLIGQLNKNVIIAHGHVDDDQFVSKVVGKFERGEYAKKLIEHITDAHKDFRKE